MSIPVGPVVDASGTHYDSHESPQTVVQYGMQKSVIFARISHHFLRPELRN